MSIYYYLVLFTCKNYADKAQNEPSKVWSFCCQNLRERYGTASFNLGTIKPDAKLKAIFPLASLRSAARCNEVKLRQIHEEWRLAIKLKK